MVVNEDKGEIGGRQKCLVVSCDFLFYFRHGRAIFFNSYAIGSKILAGFRIVTLKRVRTGERE